MPSLPGVVKPVTALIVVLMLVVPAASGAEAERGDPDTDWFQHARYGVFIHFLPGSASDLARVDDFDVEELARQLESVGAGYLVLTLGQNSGFFNSPNAAYEKTTAYRPGERCSTRDLPRDLERALARRGVRLMLYLPAQTPNEDSRAQKAFGLPQGPKDQPIDRTFARKWAEVIEEWSVRYGDGVAGWWFDGGYEWVGFDEEIARLYAGAVHRGNPHAIVTFNPGVGLKRWTRAESYTAGELVDPFDVVPTSRWVGGSQWHALTYVGSRWSARDTRHETSRWAEWVRKVAAGGGVATLDLGPNWDPHAGPIGSLADAQLEQVAAVRDELAPPDDEARVPAYTLPDPLRFEDGRPVRSPDEWRARRRPEILRLFEEHVYGRSPAAPGAMRFDVVESDPAALGGLATRRQVRVLLDGTPSGPSFEILLYVPNAARRPVPAFVGLNFDGNHAVSPDPGIRLSTAWMDDGPGVVDSRATDAARGTKAASWPVERILDRGYALATVYYGDLEPDRPDGWRDGVRARIGPGTTGRFAADDWGAIGAWAWGLQRALDYLQTDPDVDGGRVAVIGHSRLGKTALWAGAQDERFAMVVSNDSGEGGAALARRELGERTEDITRVFPHWFCAHYREYAGRESALPVDQHELLALVAPRPLYVASATEDLWADPRGEFLAAKAAEPVYRLLGRDGLGVANQPSPDRPVGGAIGYHLRTGEHALAAYDWELYLDFADRHLRPAPAPPIP